MTARRGAGRTTAPGIRPGAFPRGRGGGGPGVAQPPDPGLAGVALGAGRPRADDADGRGGARAAGLEVEAAPAGDVDRLPARVGPGPLRGGVPVGGRVAALEARPVLL